MLHYGSRLESFARAAMQEELAGGSSPTRSEDDISVGCPSPAPPRPRDYFEPLKKLKMVPPDVDGGTEDEAKSGDEETSRQFDGVKSFSILDILSHRPKAPPLAAPERPLPIPAHAPVRIVRPWDLHARGAHLERLQQQLELAQHYDIGEHIRAQLQLTEQLKAREYELTERFSAFEHRLGLTLTARDFELHHQQISDHIKAQQYALLRQKAALESQHLLRSKSVDLCSYNGASETGSERSSSVTSDCCSPDIVGAGSSRHSGGGQHGSKTSKGAGSTPLDALFQMTSKTFEANSAENGSDGQANHLNLFNSRPQPKKKRKSRTAFTNHQIFELEKRFLYQKYLSPADRDEIAASLGLSNAQVITWFQNRRAKLKRDMEELKKDVESAKVLSAHKSFLENVTDLGILKKKAISMGASEEAATNLIVSAQK